MYDSMHRTIKTKAKHLASMKNPKELSIPTKITNNEPQPTFFNSSLNIANRLANQYRTTSTINPRILAHG